MSLYTFHQWSGTVPSNPLTQLIHTSHILAHNNLNPHKQKNLHARTIRIEPFELNHRRGVLAITEGKEKFVWSGNPQIELDRRQVMWVNKTHIIVCIAYYRVCHVGFSFPPVPHIVWWERLNRGHPGLLGKATTNCFSSMLQPISVFICFRGGGLWCLQNATVMNIITVMHSLPTTKGWFLYNHSLCMNCRPA
jgi:hypothetical protein